MGLNEVGRSTVSGQALQSDMQAVAEYKEPSTVKEWVDYVSQLNEDVSVLLGAKLDYLRIKATLPSKLLSEVQKSISTDVVDMERHLGIEHPMHRLPIPSCYGYGFPQLIVKFYGDVTDELEKRMVEDLRNRMYSSDVVSSSHFSVSVFRTNWDSRSCLVVPYVVGVISSVYNMRSLLGNREFNSSGYSIEVMHPFDSVPRKNLDSGKLYNSEGGFAVEIFV